MEKAPKKCFSFEPGPTGCKAQTNPMSYGSPLPTPPTMMLLYLRVVVFLQAPDEAHVWFGRSMIPAVALPTKQLMAWAEAKRPATKKSKGVRFVSAKLEINRSKLRKKNN